MRIRAEVVQKQDPYLFAWAPSDDPDLEATIYEVMEGGGIDKRLGGDPDLALVESFVYTPEKMATLNIPADVMPSGWWLGYQVSPETYRRVAVGDQLYLEIE
jgi:hypothetical protein